MNLQNYAIQPRFLPFKTKALYPHRLHHGYFYTDDVRSAIYKDERLGFVAHIFALQKEEGALSAASVQYWDFKNLKDGHVMFMCRDHKGRELYFKNFHAPNAKIQDISFILRKNILDLVPCKRVI